jgi:hypothetical protein
VSRSPSPVVGAEYDGTVLRMVRMHGSQVTSYQSFAATPAEASALMRSQLDRRTRGLVSWGSPGATVRRSLLPGVSTRQLPVAAREIINRHIPGGSQRPGAGMAISGLHTDTPSAAVGAITADAASELHGELQRAKCSLVVAPFTLNHDGLYLAIRHSGAELILVTAGIAVASRHLRCGGLSTGLTHDPLSADVDENALAIVAGGDLLDTAELAAARRYVATLVREVRRTTDHWESIGEACPSTVWVYGPGATLPHLPSYMTSIGLDAQAPPVSQNLELDVIPPAHRLAAYGALSAALAAAGSHDLLDLSRTAVPRRARSVDLRTGDPFVGFEGVINASGTRGFATPRLDYRRPEPLPRGIGLAFFATVIAVALGIAGWWLSANALGDAERELAGAQRVLASRQAEAAFATEVGLIAEQLNSREATEPTDWAAAISPLLVFLPAFPVAESISFSEIGDTLEARIMTLTRLTDRREWTDALNLAGTVISVTDTDLSSGVEPDSTLTEFVVQIYSPVPEITGQSATTRPGTTP